ncbi:MAG TPA: methyltransferase domain-containing protein [Gallionella sp.]|nr:methyltransferase domain-containing protein [Gallionella sp.]
MVDPDFYRAFEDRFRGSREVVKSRLGVYRPFVEPLKTLDALPRALDLGCGRGEWLELLQAWGFLATGVDSDEAMLAGCRELKLDTVHSDFMEWMRNVPAESQSVVSAFHFVEHIPFEALVELVQEAHRVLKPGGLLILETQNSENLLVGASTFYIDPTHQRPIHPLQLGFIVEHAGFERIKTLYLQEAPELAAAQQQVRLFNVLSGVSPDYAVVAQKTAAKAVSALFDSCFEQPYGLRLHELAERYDRQAGNHTQWLESEWRAAQARVEELHYRSGMFQAELREMEHKNGELQAGFRELERKNEELRTESQWLRNEWDAAMARAAGQEQRAIAAEASVAGMSGSWSWKITGPFRRIWRIGRSAFRLAAKPVKAQIKSLLVHASLYVNRRPRLRHAVLGVLARFPALKNRLAFAARTAMASHAAPPPVPVELESLTPRARRIYADIKAARESGSGKGSGQP